MATTLSHIEQLQSDIDAINRFIIDGWFEDQFTVNEMTRERDVLKLRLDRLTTKLTEGE